jgi:competence protein ComEC
VLETIPVDWVGIPEDGQDWLKEDTLGEMEDVKENSWGEVSGLNPKLIKLLAREKLEKLEAGDRLLLDSDIELRVLAPNGVLTGTHSDENNNSLVLRLADGSGQSVLLTADMEEEEMQEILESGQDFSADLFKVPHHGSRFSLNLDWLNQINPRVSIISVGKNSFGHPASGVLQYWQERRIPLYRTDVNGSIQVRLDEKGIEVLPGRP